MTYAEGGIIPPPPEGAENREPIILSAGYYCTPAEAKRAFGLEMLDKINALRIKS